MDKKDATVRFVAAYILYVAIVNELGVQYGKIGGKWVKSRKFPYWDNWAYTHIAWGGIGAVMGVPPVTFLALVTANEFLLEPVMAYASEKGVKDVIFASERDPVGHKIADIIYTYIPYYTLYLLIHSK